MARMGQSFSRDLGKFTAKMERKEKDLYRKVTVAAFGGIVLTSPVDNGPFRNDWHVTVGSQDSIELPASYSRINKNGVSVKNSISISGELLTGKEDIFIVNTMPYAQGLENGRSLQAPNGIVSIVAKQIKAKLDAGAIKSD